MNKLVSVACAAALATATASSLADNGMVSVPSKYSVAETMDRLESNIRSTQPPINVFARVDLQSTAASQDPPRAAAAKRTCDGHPRSSGLRLSHCVG